MTDLEKKVKKQFELQKLKGQSVVVALRLRDSDYFDGEGERERLSINIRNSLFWEIM